ncbi:hypothetical protein U0035_06220 [Niabella yanshanensis]|uniref:Lipoprotein n=1 Tax=Niabella yanshanensis TaxID=577386 RepID=A0ABZ0W8Y8_9BACT|nr:hypothetical protein [Niabella yanshanensis]WQD39740.1 hypothetical protein U0035_06220 [Niabella yanshanensis]
MRTTVVLLIAIFLVACSKSDNKVESDCDAKMIAKFKDQITCTEIPTMGPCYYLAKGIYKGEEIYFMNIVCAACNTMPPGEGYNCDGRKIVIEDFTKNVTDARAVSPQRKD